MRKILQDKINMNDINKICIMTQGKENDHRKEELYQLTFDENDRVSFNALWALSHFDEANNPWLFQKHNELIDRVLVEKNETKRRLMLNLLLLSLSKKNHSVPISSISALPRLQPVPNPTPSAATA